MKDPNDFPAVFFADSDVNDILRVEETKIAVLKRTPQSASIYDTFKSDFSTYLTKMMAGYVKDNCMSLLNKDLILLGIAKTKPDNVVCRNLITKEDKLAGVVLDMQQLGIDVATGSTETIDQCVYATYFSLLRAGIYVNKTRIRQDKDIHKLTTTYLYFMFLKLLGAERIHTEKQKALLHMVVIYMYYRHYLKEKHPYAQSVIERDYSTFIKQEFIEELSPVLGTIQVYSSMKDFSKVLIDVKLFVESPSVLSLMLIRMLKPMGFYCLIGPLDYLISFIIINKYPVDFVGTKGFSIDKIQIALEQQITDYVDKMEYDTTTVLK